VNEAVIASGPTLRTSPAAQAQIIKLFLQGHNFVEISRQLHRDRRTIAKICRLPDVQAKLAQLREKVLAESDDWAESLNFCVRTELNGAMAYKLAKAFGVIPSLDKNVPAENQNRWVADRETMARAMVLGRIAQERGSAIAARRRSTRKTHAEGPGKVKSKASVI
jgi:hypothetical protein